MLVIAVGVVMLLSNREPAGPDGTTLINNPSHYTQVLREAEDLVQVPFEMFDSGNDLSDKDRADLRKATKLFESLNQFQPTKIGPYLGAAKAYQILGDYESAERDLQQVLNNIPIYENNDNGKRAAIEALYVMSLVKFGQGNYEEAFKNADLAVTAAPKVPNYRLARASAEVQLKKLDDAKADLQAALELDPGHPKAKRLLKFIESAQKSK